MTDITQYCNSIHDSVEKLTEHALLFRKGKQFVKWLDQYKPLIEKRDDVIEPTRGCIFNKVLVLLHSFSKKKSFGNVTIRRTHEIDQIKIFGKRQQYGVDGKSLVAAYAIYENLSCIDNNIKKRHQEDWSILRSTILPVLNYSMRLNLGQNSIHLPISTEFPIVQKTSRSSPKYYIHSMNRFGFNVVLSAYWFNSTLGERFYPNPTLSLSPAMQAIFDLGRERIEDFLNNVRDAPYTSTLKELIDVNTHLSEHFSKYLFLEELADA